MFLEEREETEWKAHWESESGRDGARRHRKARLCCRVWSFCEYIDSADSDSFETTGLLTQCGTDGTAPCSPPQRAIVGPSLRCHRATAWTLSCLSAVAWPLAGPEDPAPAIRIDTLRRPSYYITSIHTSNSNRRALAEHEQVILWSYAAFHSSGKMYLPPSAIS